MSTVQAPALITEGETWFRPSRPSFSRNSFDFSCFEEDGIFDCDLDALLSSANTAPPSVPPPSTNPSEEFQYAPQSFMWPSCGQLAPPLLPEPHSTHQQSQQDARFLIQHHSPELTSPRRPVIHQNLLYNTSPQSTSPHYQRRAWEMSSLPSGEAIAQPNTVHAEHYSLASDPAIKPVKHESCSEHERQLYHSQQQSQPMCQAKVFKTEEPSRECGSPSLRDSDSEIKSPGKNSQYTFMDITPFMTLPQAEAARQLGIPVSTLSKRWRVATGRRKWPWRVVSKLDKEITTLLYNINIGTGSGKNKDKDLEERLSYLLAKREKALRSVRIRISNKQSSG